MSTLFDLATQIVNDHAFITNLNRVVEKAILGKCICTEPDRRLFKCPVHEQEEIPQ